MILFSPHPYPIAIFYSTFTISLSVTTVFLSSTGLNSPIISSFVKISIFIKGPFQVKGLNYLSTLYVLLYLMRAIFAKLIFQ